MRPIRKTYNSTGAKEWIPLDIDRNPFSVTVAVTLPGGVTGTYTIEHTATNINADNGALTPRVFPHPAAELIAATSSQDGTYTSPVYAVRINIAAVAGGSIELEIIQAGHQGA